MTWAGWKALELRSTGLSVSFERWRWCQSKERRRSVKPRELQVRPRIWVAHQNEANGRPSGLGLRFLLARAPLSFLTYTTSFDDGLHLPAAKRARRRTLSIRCPDPSFVPRQGYLRRSTSSSRSRFCRRTPHYDKGTSPPILRR